MARALRTEFPGAVYHITSRGNARGRLFLDEADEKTFLRTPRARGRPVRRPLAELFNELGADALAVAFRDEGYHLREIAEHLGVHYSTVSRRLRALDEGGRTG